MTETAMFQPLSPEETVAAEAVTERAAQDQTKPVPIVPVPEDAPPMQYRHPEHGAPSKVWPYHDSDGRLVGYVLRWDFTNSDGEPDKDIRPVCYCDIGGGRRAWRPVGMPLPRPLLRLPDVLARRDARVLVCEGEKAADAAAKLFEGLYLTEKTSVKNSVTDSTSGMVPDLVATTPPHGALSPHKADWTPLKDRHVVVWPDNDEAGGRVCRGRLSTLHGLGSGFRGHCASASRLPAQVGLGGRAA